jgi:hypothetical protein
MQAPNIQIIYKPIYCSPCVHEVDEPPCGGNNVCMQRIGVDEVLEAARRLLAGERADSSKTGHTPDFFSNQFDHALGRIERGSIQVF